MITINKIKKQSKIKSLFSGFFDRRIEKLLIGFFGTVVGILLVYLVIVLFFLNIKFTLFVLCCLSVCYIVGHFIMKWNDANND